ncbi:MAG: hypothetical protein JWQ66_3250 [Mucilaginibacter sp.]|nr:hypothetical protein [Mucilaginibacter sp.]
MKTTGLSREELYEQVWSKPVSKLEQELSLSNWDIKQLCKKMEVPLPPVGHWSRVQFGKPVERLVLPPLSPEAEKASVKADTSAEPDLRESRQVHEPPILFPGEQELSFAVPDRLVNPDKLIIAAEHTLRSRITKPNSEFGTVHTELGQLNIRVAPGNINRALRIMDTLVKCWRRRGYRIEFDGRDTLVCRRKVEQRVRLWEITTKRPKEMLHGYQLYDPTGKLAFKMEYYMGREWRDGKQFLEDQILDILNQMEVAARQLEKGWAEQAEQDARREAEQRETVVNREAVVDEGKVMKTGKVGKKKKKFKKLLKEAKHWKELKVLDEYLAELFSRPEPTPEFLEWFARVQKRRHQADPLKKT